MVWGQIASAVVGGYMSNPAAKKQRKAIDENSVSLFEQIPPLYEPPFVATVETALVSIICQLWKKPNLINCWICSRRNF